jgi:probable FeS assembly SUF system protein SufT
MNEKQWVSTEYDIEALLIPTAVPITIPGGTECQIIQTLGGHVTINIRGNLARVDRKDVEALGIDLGDTAAETFKKEPCGPIGPVDEELVWAQLRTVYDPEIPVNIVDLGLIYNIRIKPIMDANGNMSGNLVEMQMTLTAPGCGMGPVITADAEAKVRQIPNATDFTIELVFDPPWDKTMMTEAAKLELGLF